MKEYISYEDIAKYYHEPLSVAAEKLGLSVCSIRKICKENGLSRWPHRKVLAINNRLQILDGTPENKRDNYYYELCNELEEYIKNFNEHVIYGERDKLTKISKYHKYIKKSNVSKKYVSKNNKYLNGIKYGKESSGSKRYLLRNKIKKENILEVAHILADLKNIGAELV